MALSPKLTYTVEQFINAGNGVTITYHNMSYIEQIGKGLAVPFFNVINDYIDELVSFSVTIELSDEEYEKYRYKPKLLCSDIYGNPELYFIILRINDMADVKQFSKRKFKALPKSNMEKAMTFIYNAEKRIIDQYND